jgi:two-component sensor histidine kinase
MDSFAQVRPKADSRLALAVVASSNAPLLLLDGDLDVVAASDSFCAAFQLDPASVRHRPLAALGDGEWAVPQLDSLLRATAGGHAEIDAYEMDLKREGVDDRCLVLNAHKLDHGDPATIRLLLAISDVTDARRSDKLKDDLVREKAILLQELQHRVANSLQIIASVLMQSARRVKSDETRDHLYDAHSRVMSIASLQSQLAASRLGEVELRPYFTELCRTIGASMIRDPRRIALEVSVDDSRTGADASVSLGLIVTELVINALKHAFPGNRAGRILVDYKSGEGAAWTLSVVDDGVGMPAEPFSAVPGLGTSIVGALAAQLGARVDRSAAEPGAAVFIVHD